MPKRKKPEKNIKFGSCINKKAIGLKDKKK